MKIIQNISKLILVFGLIGAISCTKDFEELNQDPNSFNEASPENLFAGIVINTLDLVGGTMNDDMYLQYASYGGGKGGQFATYYYTESGVSSRWNSFYVSILKNTQEIIDNYSDNPEYTNRVHIAKIWKSYVYSIMVSTFGGVPMNEALAEATTMKYDSEEEIYTAILTMLKEAGEGIDPAGDELAADPIFDGNNTMWIKFANSLRLKIALRISTGFPQLAQEHGTAAMSNESALVSSNGENIYMQWGTEQDNWSFNYYRYIFSDIGQSTYPMVNHHFLLNLKTYNDPRLPVLVQEATAPFLILDTMFAEGSTTDTVIVSYNIPYVGNTLRGGGGGLTEWDLDGNDNPLNGYSNEDYSRPGEQFFEMDMKYYIITNAEMNLMKAEAQLKGWGGSQSAEEYYYAGIDASFEHFGVQGATEYKAQDGIKWGTTSEGDRNLWGINTSGITADPMDKIVRQRWINGYHHGHDAYCLRKRTRLLPLAPRLAEDWTGAYSYTVLPERMIYPLTEEAINYDGYQAAVTALGGNNMTSTLQMNKPLEDVDLTTLPAEYNWDFVSHWYGNAVDDLIAAGVEYEIIEELDSE